MKTSQWLKMTALAAVCIGMLGCTKGEYNDTVCDQTYVDECIDSSFYIYCKIKDGETTGLLERARCADSEVCDQLPTQDENGNTVYGPAQCFPINAVPDKPTTCVESATRCAADFVQTCTEGVWVNATEPCANGCDKGACISGNTPSNPEQPNPGDTCEFEGATQCKGETVQTCTAGVWVNASQPCAEGCSNGVCKETVTSCSFSSKCDGNIVKNCYDLSDYGMGVEYYAENCKNYGMVCDEFDEDGETYAYCMMPCETEGSRADMCSEDFFGSAYVTQGVCTKVDGNKLYYIEDYTADMIMCPGLCDYANGECLIRAEGEGDACDPKTYQERCENGLAVICKDGIVTVMECTDNTVCKVNAETQMAYCTETCTTENDTTKICDNSYYEDYEVEFLDTYQCLKTTDQDLAIFPVHSDMCSSCQDLTCTITDQDRGTHLAEGDICNLNLFENRCSNESTMYSCEADYDVMEYVVTVTECENSCQVAIVNDKHTVACAQGTCETVGSTAASCATTSDGASYNTTHTCLATESGTNHYFVTGYTECEGICNPETQTCVLLHPDQGKACTGMADYPDRCQNNVLAYCYIDVVDAVDCSREPGYTCQTSTALNGYGDCVQTCDTPTELTKVCEYSEEYQRNIVYSRVCETIGDANYYFNAVEDDCPGECNDEGTGCK